MTTRSAPFSHQLRIPGTFRATLLQALTGARRGALAPGDQRRSPAFGPRILPDTLKVTSRLAPAGWSGGATTCCAVRVAARRAVVDAVSNRTASSRSRARILETGQVTIADQLSTGSRVNGSGGCLDHYNCASWPASAARF